MDDCSNNRISKFGFHINQSLLKFHSYYSNYNFIYISVVIYSCKVNNELIWISIKLITTNISFI